MKELDHLSDIFDNYDTYVIDLWGVIHNGVKLNQKAINTIEQLNNNLKKIVFLSNAPRPSSNVINFLLKMNMNKKYLSNVMTSGEAAMYAINKNKFGKTFFHLGPPRDTSVFEKVKENNVSIENCDFILCTGLFDDHDNDLEYYKKYLKNHISKKLICTNPDLTVHRGNEEEYCAGKIAEIYKSLGGEVVYFGKPHKDIYDLILKEGERNLVIGDNLNTDIRGANNLNIDSLFITNGVHRSEFKSEQDLTLLLINYNVKSQFFQKELCW